MRKTVVGICMLFLIVSLAIGCQPKDFDQIQTVKEENSIRYEDKTYGYSIEIPKHYEIEERDKETVFYYDVNGKKERAFAINVFEKESWEKDKNLSAFKHLKVIKEANEFVYLLNPIYKEPIKSEEYHYMIKEREKALKTFQLSNEKRQANIDLNGDNQEFVFEYPDGENYGFVITFPDAWKDKYRPIMKDKGITVEYKIEDKKYENVFSIAVWTVADLELEKRNNNPILNKLQLLGEANGYVYLLEKHDRAKDFVNDIDDIVNSFEISIPDPTIN